MNEFKKKNGMTKISKQIHTRGPWASSRKTSNKLMKWLNSLSRRPPFD